MNDFKIGDDPERLARPHWTVALKAENAALKAENAALKAELLWVRRVSAYARQEWSSCQWKAALIEIELRLLEAEDRRSHSKGHD